MEVQDMDGQEISNRDTKLAIWEALEKGDTVELLQLGFNNFMKLVNDRPISFRRFLKYTSNFLDDMIQTAEVEENLIYIGGKLILELKRKNSVSLFAELFFQDISQKNWIRKERKGHVPVRRFRDWNTSPELIELQETKRIEFPIDAPSVRETR